MPYTHSELQEYLKIKRGIFWSKIELLFGLMAVIFGLLFQGAFEWAGAAAFTSLAIIFLGRIYTP